MFTDTVTQLIIDNSLTKLIKDSTYLKPLFVYCGESLVPSGALLNSISFPSSREAQQWIASASSCWDCIVIVDLAVDGTDIKGLTSLLTTAVRKSFFCTYFVQDMPPSTWPDFGIDSGCHFEPVLVLLDNPDQQKPQVWCCNKILDIVPLSEWRKVPFGFHVHNLFIMPREAKNWEVEHHLYRVNVNRQDDIADDKHWNRLMANPHQNLANLLFFNERWLVFEYVEGLLFNTHTRFLPKERKNLPDFLSQCDEIAAKHVLHGTTSALKHLHSIGICHSDPCSFNIMVDKQGEAKLIDLAECVSATSALLNLDWHVYETYTVRVAHERLLQRQQNP